MGVVDLPRLTQNCQSCPIRHRAVCASCEPDELNALERIKYYRSFQAGDPIIWTGDAMDFVATVISGVATLTQTMEDGRRQMVGLLLPSDFMGRPGRARATYDVVAATDLRLCCFRRKPFEDMLQQTPHLSQRLLVMALDELDASRDWQLLLGRKTALEKIATLLVILARRSAIENQTTAALSIGPLAVDLPLSREQTADYLGLTLETVSRKISALRRSGMIALEGNRRVTIKSLAALRLVSGEHDPERPADRERA